MELGRFIRCSVEYFISLPLGNLSTTASQIFEQSCKWRLISAPPSKSRHSGHWSTLPPLSTTVPCFEFCTCWVPHFPSEITVHICKNLSYVCACMCVCVCFILKHQEQCENKVPESPFLGSFLSLSVIKGIISRVV